MTTDSAVPSVEDARRIARALVGDDPTPDETARWQDAVATVALPLAGPGDRALWDVARRGGAGLGLVDAGLAFLEPYSPVRHRLYLMLAVLEASPAHVPRFEAGDRPAGAVLASLAARGALAVVRSLAGLVVVGAYRAFAR